MFICKHKYTFTSTNKTSIMKTKEITIKAQGEPKSVLDMTPYELAVEQERNQKYDAEFMEDFLDAHGWGDYTD